VQIHYLGSCIQDQAGRPGVDVRRYHRPLSRVWVSAAALVALIFATSCGSPAGSNAGNPGGTGPAQVQHQVILSWTASPSTDVVGYYVYRGSTVDGPFRKLNSSPVDAITYNDRAVVAGMTYYYVVTAVNGNGAESSYSNEASATVPTP